MLNNFKIKKKLLIMTFIMLVMTVIISVNSVYNEILMNRSTIKVLDQSIRKDYDNEVKSQVKGVLTLLDGLYKKYKSGEITLSQAKKMGADLIRNMRYDEHGYFWVDTPEGINVVLLGSKTEGTNRYNFRDTRGKLVVQEAIKKAKRKDGGYINYYFPKIGEKKSYPKRAYSKLFKPFNWVIGTGNYTDDIDKIMLRNEILQNKKLYSSILIFIALSVIFTLLAILISNFISKSITTPLSNAVWHAEQISEGFLTVNVPEEFKMRKDEVGELENSIDKMRDSIKELIKSLEEKSKALEDEKELLHTTLVSVGDAVITTDENGRIKIINKIAEKITGWKQEEAFDKPFEEVFDVINETTGQKYDNLFKKVFETGEIIELTDFIILISKNGTTIPIEDSIAPIKDNLGATVGIVLVFRDVSEKKKKQEEIKYLSFHDQLTGLYNRRFFDEEIKRIDTKRNYPLSIVMADVDGLKLTNDAFGHLLGDKLIKMAGEVIKDECRQDDIIARIGGDEFVILLPKSDEDNTKILLERLKKAISTKKIGCINLSISFGCFTKTADDITIEEIFKRAENNMYQQKLAESQKIKEEMVNQIIKSMYEKYDDFEEYQIKVIEMCENIARSMNLDSAVIEELKLAASVYDLGNMTVDWEILNKKGRLNELEFKEMRQHPEKGYNILRSVNSMAKISEYVLAHHEWWNGEGYPSGLKEKEIPIQSRIIAVADTYNAMISDRPYRKAFSKEESIKYIKMNSGIQFDPLVVNAFIELYT